MTEKGNPLGIIPFRSDEPPYACIQVNKHWLPFLYAAIYPSRYPEAWLGTLEENKQARLDVLALIAQIELAESCDDMAQCCELTVMTTVILHQVNPITFQLEISIDGGITWTPDPQSIANTTTKAVPAVTSGVSANKCDAAENGKNHIADWVAGVTTAFDTYGDFFLWCAEVLLVMLGLILWMLTIGALTPQEIAVIQAIMAGLRQVFNGGKAAWVAYWTQDEYDKLLCALYCSIGDDGGFTDAQMAEFINRVEASMAPGPARLLFILMLGQIGSAGLTNLCSYGTAVNADCSDCNCGCASPLVIEFGTLIDAGDNYYDIEAVERPGFPGEYIVFAGFDENNPAVCCNLVGHEALEGNPTVVGAVMCNDPDWSNFNFSFHAPGCVRRLDFAAFAPFTMRLTFAPC